MRRNNSVAGVGAAVVGVVGLLLFGVACAFGQTVINIAGPAAGGEGWTFAGGEVRITANGSYTVTGATTGNRVVVGEGVVAEITLRDVSISNAVASPLELSSEGCEVRLQLEGANTLTSTVPDAPDGVRLCPGIQVEGASTTLTIEGSGTLTATGGIGGAGIGSGLIGGQPRGGNPGNIIIKSGTINATGGTYAAGIGGGAECDGGNISITGGAITATGGGAAAGIGGGYHGTGGNIRITGGVVLAIAEKGAGIGGGEFTAAGNVTITGGSVFAYSLPNAWGEGAGIGGGEGNDGGEGSISIAGGSVIASRIGIAQNSTNTPTTVTGGAILTESINTTSFGQAEVQTGVVIPLNMMRAMAENILVDTVVRRDTVAVGDGGRDTVWIEVPGDTVGVRDTVRDTVRMKTRETIVITLHDTLFAPVYVDRWHDTFVRYYPVEEHDTVYITDWRTQFVRDTTEVRDTLVIDEQVYIVVEQAFGTRTESAEVRSLRVENSGEGVVISGLMAGVGAVVFDLGGRVVAREVVAGTTWRISALSSGTYIVWQAGRWGKFVQR